MIDISVVSGTYNRLELLKRMIKSVRKSVEDHSYEIILVDGGSTDGTIEWCREQKDVILIEQGELFGAIKAFNAGCEVVSGKYTAILNDDIEVVGNTLHKAFAYLQSHPKVGQVAFRNRIIGKADKHRTSLSGAYGYRYGQCCMTRTWLGHYAGWWGSEGMHTYGGDSRFSLRLWEMGWPTVSVDGCAIKDYVHEDELRKINNQDQRGGPNNKHPDTIQFRKVWDGRLPDKNEWIEAPVNVVLGKVRNRTLRTLKFKGMMARGEDPRMGLTNVFGRFGPARQYAMPTARNPREDEAFQQFVFKAVQQFNPDLLFIQGQREGRTSPRTVRQLKVKYPHLLVVNFDGDCHFPLTRYHFDIARAVDLHLTISPDLFDIYNEKGIGVGYWPIGIEEEYLDDIERRPVGPDVVFLGANYGHSTMPEGRTREKVVKALWNSKLDVRVYGRGWNRVNIKAGDTAEQHKKSAEVYARSKMALSISQSKDLWGYTSDRLYNVCASGCAALVQRFAGMEEHGYIDGATCIAWSTVDELLRKAQYYVEHDQEREQIALQGKQMTRTRHSWDARIWGLWTMLEGMV